MADDHVTFDAFSMYQKAALTTAMYPDNLTILYPTLGLNGEAGEVAEKVKKLYRDRNGVIDEEFRDTMVKELGDVLWYLAVLAADLQIDLGKIAETNLQKLQDRYKRGKIRGDGDNR